ncbi:MAG: cytochrome c-type biogenesis protein CcmH, partial [Burkholderiaceae bacterium]|nr:cytochrome c-type biogenesis protein CcmH [Burkholderiaceae bacterium]
MMRGFLMALTMATVMHGAGATEAASLAADPVLEARVLKVAEELRCLVCQNETI